MVVLRSAEDVLQDHLHRRKLHDLEEDLTCNCDDKLIAMSKDGVFHGKDGIRHTAAILQCNPTQHEIQFMIWFVLKGELLF